MAKLIEKKPKSSETDFSEAEAAERFEKALRGGLMTSPIPLKDKPKVNTAKESRKKKTKRAS